MKTHWKAVASCNRSALDFLPEAVRKAELIRPQVATFGKLQKADLDPSVCVVPFRASVGSCYRLGHASASKMVSRDRHFLTNLRGMKQLKSLASGSPPEARGDIFMVCSRALTVFKKRVSWVRRLLGCAARVIARLLPDRPDFLMPHHCFQGSKYECHA